MVRKRELEEAVWRLLKDGLGLAQPVDFNVSPALLPAILSMAEASRIGGIVAEGYLKHRPENILTQAEENQLLAIKSQYMGEHAKADGAVASLARLLSGSSIPFALLKGQGNKRFYPDPLMRSTGDIDILVSPDDIERLKALVIRKGGVNPDTIHDSGKHIEFGLFGSLIEPHRVPAEFPDKRRDRIFREWTHQQFAAGIPQVSVGGESLNVPTATFNAFFLFYHAFNQLLSPYPRLKHFPDFALMLHSCRSEIDTRELKQVLMNLNMMDAWQKVGCFVVEYLGLPPSEYPLYSSKHRRAARRIKKILSRECLAGEALAATRKDAFTRKFHTLSSFGRLLTVFPLETALELRRYISWGLRACSLIFVNAEAVSR